MIVGWSRHEDASARSAAIHCHCGRATRAVAFTWPARAGRCGYCGSAWTKNGKFTAAARAVITAMKLVGEAADRDDYLCRMLARALKRGCPEYTARSGARHT